MRYPAERKEAILKKMLPPHNKTIAELAKEEGISEGALYNWRKSARMAGRLPVVVEPLEPALALGNEWGLECPVAITRDLNRQGAGFGLNRLRRLAVAEITAAAPFRRMGA